MMIKAIALLAFLAAVSVSAGAQVEPAATGPARPSGSFNYSLHDTENAWWSGALGNQLSNSISGIVDYQGGKSRRPLSVSYAGGYTFTLSQPTYDTGYFQNMSVSQGIAGHKWRLTFSDVLTFLPQSPSFGLAGVPGSGDTSAGPPPVVGTPSQTVLSDNTHTLNNMSSVSYGVPINYALSITAAGNYQFLHFPSNTGINTSAVFGSFGASWRFNARTSMSGEVSEAQYGYSGTQISFRTTGLQASVSHQWSKGFSTQASIGPNWISSSGGALIPSGAHLSVSGSASYHKRFDTVAVEYYHSTNEGSGFFYGAQFDSLSASYGRKIERETTLSARFGLVRNSGLQAGSGSTTGIYTGVSVSRRLGKMFSLGANYLAVEQASSANAQLPSNVLNATLQGVSFSVGFAPRGMRNIEQR